MKNTPARWLLWTAAALLSLLFVVAAGIVLLLPIYIEGRLIPKLAAAVHLDPDQVEVRRLGGWGADLGPIRFSRDHEAAVSVAAVQVDYSPLGLLRGEVTGIRLVGLEIALRMGPEGLRVAGQVIPPSPGAGTDRRAAIRLEGLLPIALKRFAIVRSHLRVDWHPFHHRLPIDIHLQTDRLQEGFLEGRLQSSLLGNAFVLTTRIDQRANRLDIDLNADRLALDTLASLLPEARSLAASGTAALEVRSRFDLHSLEVLDLFVIARADNGSLTTPLGQLRALPAGASGGPPLVLTLAGDGVENLTWSCAPFHLAGPLTMAVPRLAGRLAITEQGWSLTGDLETRLAKQRLPLPEVAELAKALPLAWRLAAHRTGGAKAPVRFALESQNSGPVRVRLGERRLSVRHPRVTVSGRYADGVLAAEGRAGVEKIQFSTPQIQLQSPELTVSATAQIPDTGSGRAATLTLNATMRGLGAAAGSAKLQLPKITLDLSGRADTPQPWGFKGQLQLTNGWMTDSESGLAMAGLDIDLPLAWPPAPAKPGYLDLATIRWRGSELGALKGILQQDQSGLNLNLRQASTLFPGMDLLIKGRLASTGTRVQVRIPPHEIATDIDLGRFIPEAAGVLGRGRISAVAELAIDAEGPKATGRFKISGGRVQAAARNLTLDGIDLAVQMSDLVALQSAPQQQLTIAALAVGDLAAERLKVDFQVENAQTLFIEKAGLDWCQGRVNTAALRINAARADYNLTLYCDRLNLAQLLNQLGTADASGRGSVNGRLPVSWVDQRLAFDKGFLYSTPGESGTIRLTGTEALLTGLPPGTPQHTQLDIATEALKDYSYRWAKLHLESEGEILLLKLQLDGKPNRLLPFAYDQTLGQFKRVAGAGQAEFKGISIDLNFRSPLNEIIHYKELFDTK